jgi:hypothetical protein
MPGASADVNGAETRWAPLMAALRAPAGFFDDDAVIIRADWSLSRVGAVAGLVDDLRVLWRFAVRGYSNGPPGCVPVPLPSSLPTS